MITEDIEFIKTDKEGDNLLYIQENYPNSIIDVNSNKEKNLYIGTDRITDNYNLGVDENSITNNVGGMSSGINASDLKGKSISEILDIILFASNNNMTLKGVQVVDKVENLKDDTLKDVYKGMVVSVVEDNSLYILLTEPDNEREWKKVGADVDIEEIKTYSKELTEPITVAGLSGSLGANISNGKTYTNIEDILRDLLCIEIYPNVSLSTTNPTISFGGLVGATASNNQSLMEVGSVLNLNSVTLSSASISSCSRRGSDFTYGYSSTKDGEKIKDNPPSINGTSSLVGSYTLTETYSPSSIGTPRQVSSSDNCDEVKFGEESVTVALGTNEIKITATSPSGKYTHPEYQEYFVVSNAGNTNENEKLSKNESIDKIDGTIESKTSESTISVTGVYPVYVNIDYETNSLVDEPIKMALTKSNVIEFDVPSGVLYKKHFIFDYPATHSISSFELQNFAEKYVSYDADYNPEFEIVTKTISGKEVQYKRLATLGENYKGDGKYRITLSMGLDKDK